MITSSSLVAPQVLTKTTYAATIDDSFGIMTNLSFRRYCNRHSYSQPEVSDLWYSDIIYNEQARGLE